MGEGQRIKNVFHILGYNVQKPIFPILQSFLTAIIIAMCLGVVNRIVDYNNIKAEDGHKLIKFIIGLKDLNVLLSILCVSVAISARSRVVGQTISYVDKTFSKYGKEFSSFQYKLILNRESFKRNTLNRMKTLLFVITFVLTFLPGAVATYLIIKEGVQEINVHNLPLPFLFYYPRNYDTLPVYIVIYVLQSAILFNGISHGYCIFGLASISIQTIVTDIKLLCLDLTGVDRMLHGCSTGREYLYHIKDYTKYLISCHQDIQRSVKLVTHCISLLVTISHQAICLHICASLLCATEVDNKLAKIAYCTTVIAVSVSLLIYCANGQNIINANEELRKALYKCPWLDKPIWFKKDLQTMMSMANVPLHVKPLGLYVLDLKSFTTIMNAAYTYYNLLRTVKR